MRKSVQFIKSNLFAIILILATVFVAYQNYSPETFLTGWDTLHPEFNFGLYWKRIIKGVWQEHQGLGAVASQAHPAEIPRILLLQFFSLFLKTSQIRYAYAFLMLILGPLGVFYLLKLSLFKNADEPIKNISSFIGALIYLLNLSTLQHFYVPLEMFLTHFAFLGWLVLFVVKYLDTEKRRYLVLFSLTSFLSAPQAHTSTLFVAYFMFLFAFLFGRFLIKPTFNVFKKSAILIIITILINSFWLFPNMYFILERGEDVANSKIHSLFSDEAFLQNEQFGDIGDTAILRNFLFNWGEHVGKGKFGDLLNEWKSHQSRFLVLPIGYLVFAGYLIGGIISTIKGRKYAFPIFLSSFVALFFIMNTNPPLGFIFRFFQAYLPLFEEAFRFPFTKFSNILAFGYSTLFAFCIFELLQLLKNKLEPQKYKISKIATAVVVPALIVYYMFPVFTGNLISPSMRVEIPDRYFEMFEYFDDQNEYGRVADFPIHSFWGWNYYDWHENKKGFQGAGFLWFGIKQPLLNREFDRWDPENEQYYREMSYAVYSKDVELFETLLEKYQIKWLLVDESLFSPDSGEDVLFLDEIRALFNKSPKVELAQDFGDGLLVYEVLGGYKHKKILSKDEYVYGDKHFNKEAFDPIYNSFGDYVNSSEDVYPFVGITNQDESLISTAVSSGKDRTYLRLSTTGVYERSVVVLELFLRQSEGDYFLDISDVSDPQERISLSVNLNNPLYVSLNSEVFTLNREKAGSSLGRVYLDTSNDLIVKKYQKQRPSVLRNLEDLSVLETCSGLGRGSAYSWELKKGGFELTAKSVDACVTIPIESVLDGDTIQNEQVLLDVETFYEGEDVPGDLCLWDLDTDVCVGRYITTDNSIEVISEIQSQRLDEYFLRFTTKGESAETTVSYSNIKVSLLAPYFDESFEYTSSTETLTPFNDLLSFEKLLEYDPADLRVFSDPVYCSSGENVREEVSYTPSGIKYESKGKFICDSISLKSLDPSLAYIVQVRSRNASGLPMRMCILNKTTSRCDKYVSLPKSKEFIDTYYLLPPGVDVGKYSLDLVNMYFGEDEFINEINYVSFTPVPYDFLKNLHNEIKPGSGELLVLNESYDSGWKALCGLGLCKAEHKRVNNWANGWVFENSQDAQKAKVIFWPQYLEYLGFIFVPVVFVLIVKIKRN